MLVRFTPLGKGSNRRSWHMLSQSPPGFKEWYEKSQYNRDTFEAFCKDPDGFINKMVQEYINYMQAV